MCMALKALRCPRALRGHRQTEPLCCSSTSHSVRLAVCASKVKHQLGAYRTTAQTKSLGGFSWDPVIKASATGGGGSVLHSDVGPVVEGS